MSKSQKRKSGPQKTMQVGGFARKMIREDSKTSDVTYGIVVTEMIQRWSSIVGLLAEDLGETFPSKGMKMTLTDKAWDQLKSTAKSAGVKPSSALNMIILWNYLTLGVDSSKTK